MSESGDAWAEEYSPAEAFERIGHEHRVAILDGLLDLHRAGDEYPASFSQLRRVSSIPVSSKFSYHLDKLTGSYLKHTEDGYAFLTPGWNAATAIRERAYHHTEGFCDQPITGTCPECEREALTSSYQEEWVTICCTNCHEQLIRYPARPGLFEGRTIPEFLRAFDRIVRTDVTLARDGICPACSGPMACQTSTNAPTLGDSARAVFTCERCGNRLTPSFGLVLIDEPPVKQYRNQPERRRESPAFWEQSVSMEAIATVTQENPWRCEIELAPPDGVVVLVDEALSIRSPN